MSSARADLAALRSAPFALVAAQAHGLKLCAVNRPAAEAGLEPGMALTDARALVPDLASRPAEPEADARALAHLADWATRYSPWVATDGADSLLLDVTGCAHLFGGEDTLLADLVRRLDRMGIAGRVGLAETVGAAWAVARASHTTAIADAIVPPGGVAAALAELPVRFLRLDGDTALTLRRLGLARIGGLYDIPRAALARRFDRPEAGEAVLTRLDQALGLVDEPLSPLAPPPAYRARAAFAEPVMDAEVMAQVLADLAGDVVAPLARDQQGARRLSFVAYRADGTVGRVTAATSRPTRDPVHIRRLFAEQLSGIDPGFGIDLLMLTIDRAEPLAASQLALTTRTDGKAADGAAVARLADRLATRLGPGRVARTVPHASHIPERAACRGAPVATGVARRARWTDPRPDTPPRPFRLLTRPEPVEVVAEVPEGPPLSFRWRRVLYRIARAEGPERVAPEWWRGDAGGRGRVRDYYRVEDAAGRRFWVYRDGLYQEHDQPGPPQWFLHGLFG